jgi:hypothetical protein
MSAEHDSFYSHLDGFIPRDESSGVAFGHLHGQEGMSADEIRHRIADQHDVDPGDVTVTGVNGGEISRAPHDSQSRTSRSFGFSKWGANWEPTGPGGDPSLN